MKKFFCLLMAAVLLLTGCGGSTSTEREAPVPEPAVITEPTTLPTEPKTFFEEQGFEFWEEFQVHDTMDGEDNHDGGFFAEARFPNSAECKVTMRSGDREEITYYLTDTKMEVRMDNYTLAEFDQACKEKILSTENIKNPSDSLYKAFKKEDNNLTKDAWLDQYRDYRVIHGQFTRRFLTGQKVLEAKHAMDIGQSKWEANALVHGELLALLDCTDGRIFESDISAHPGIAEAFSISAEQGTVKIGIVADEQVGWKKSGIAKDIYEQEFFFVMVPDGYKDLVFVLPLMVVMDRTLEDFDAYVDKIIENPWEEKNFTEYTEGYEHMKYYFLSPFYY